MHGLYMPGQAVRVSEGLVALLTLGIGVEGRGMQEHVLVQRRYRRECLLTNLARKGVYTGLFPYYVFGNFKCPLRKLRRPGPSGNHFRLGINANKS